MKTKQTAKQTDKAKKPAGKSDVRNLRVTERQSKDIKGGAARGKA